jgi:hypothetical protein
MPLVPLFAFALAAGPIDSGYLSAGDLATRCKDNSPAAASYCFAYITGVHDSVRAYETWLKLREFCIPYNTSQSELRRAFTVYVDANPGDRAGSAASVVVVSLKKAYACPPLITEPLPSASGKKATRRR